MERRTAPQQAWKAGPESNPVKCMGNSKRSNQGTALERESVWRHRALEIDGEGALLRQQEWCRESFDGSLMDEEVYLLVIRQLGSEEMVGGGKWGSLSRTLQGE